MQSLGDSVNPNSASSMDPTNNDFKMTSLGEVQRIIGLSLSKIQLGRNQRGGLPLHKNLLVATVLNKARDLYMQETMYMNYKMMTGQFAAAASAANHQGSQMMGLGGQHQSPYPSHAAYHYHAASNHTSDGTCEEDLEPQAEANDADYDEDSESDVEDECDNTSSARVVTPSVSGMSPYHHPVMSSMQSSASSGVNQTSQPQSPHGPNQPGLHNQQPLTQPSHPQSMSQVQQPHSSTSPSSTSSSNSNDEGFIDEPDCDCDARNFSTSESRVPFQYCYHCAPFHPSNGRGPTLVPSPCSASLPSTPVATTSATTASASATVTSSTVTSSDFMLSKTSTLYDMDSQPSIESNSAGEECDEVNGLRGTKRARSQSLDTSTDEEESEPESQAKKVRRESEEGSSSSDTSQDESGYQSDSSHHEMFHPAFRGASQVTTSSATSPPAEGSGPQGQTMEIDQITSLVSIFSFVQHNMAAAAAANNRASNTSSTETRTTSTTTEDEEDKKGEGGGHSPSSEDSDSESDTSSDSGHSSDDHEAAKEEELSSPVSASSTTTTPSDSCATSVASVVVASEAPSCVEVASL